MRLILTYELDNKTELELSVLFCKVAKHLPRTKRGTPDRRNTLASLENIARVRREKMTGPRL